MPKVNLSYVQERKEYIIDCTYKVLNGKALKDINMRDVIKETGFSQGTIYNYYKNIDEIISVIICRYMVHMKERLSGCIDYTNNFDDIYNKICDCMVDMYEENPELFEGMLGRISYSTEPRENQEILYEVFRAGEDLNNIVIELLNKGIEQGVVRADLNMHIAVFYLWSGLGQIIIFSHGKQKYIEEQLKMSRQEYMKQGFELIARSIMK